MLKPKISIAGCGFVGLVNAAAFAASGFEVIATTLNKDEAEMINNGKAPFYERDLDDLLEKAVDSRKLRVITDNREAIVNTDITFISVGTPMRKDYSIDLSYINSVSEDIGRALAEKNSYHLIIDRSTVVPGTTRNMIGKNIEKNSKKSMGNEFGLCMQPEFLAEGRAVEDTYYPDRIVIGELDEKSGSMLEKLYQDFYGEHLVDCPVLRMTIESAELVKYGNNCLLATKISFANEFANLAELIPNVDVKQVMEGVGLDYRINPRFLNAGAGFGGSCFPKDVNAIKAWGRDKGYETRLLNAVLDINRDQAIHLVDIAEELVNNLEKKRIALLGLSFKPDTSDMREAASLKIIDELIRRGIKDIIAYDPKAIKEAKETLGNKIKYAISTEDALKNAECAFLVTEWEEFKNLKPNDYKRLMREPNLIDGRRIYPFTEYSEVLNFRAIGRIK
ncbi:MAG: nucleotide sugar dehydrogenase [Candidatus Lokiarchaeota archaeon]|nr:nucleotide sugar dehydrogenase [Candidatus Lokiarchaeota archaeon]